ncbi:hypothetical protein CPC08DRAFT_768857 [Agrocybe pediades]|nr:hypothetical protein CPC08DRAFT_768857 [Agrocybe pediades]
MANEKQKGKRKGKRRTKVLYPWFDSPLFSPPRSMVLPRPPRAHYSHPSFPALSPGLPAPRLALLARLAFLLRTSRVSAPLLFLPCSAEPPSSRCTALPPLLTLRTAHSRPLRYPPLGTSCSCSLLAPSPFIVDSSPSSRLGLLVLPTQRRVVVMCGGRRPWRLPDGGGDSGEQGMVLLVVVDGEKVVDGAGGQDGVDGTMTEARVSTVQADGAG